MYKGMLLVIKSVGFCFCNSDKFKHECFYETRQASIFPLQKTQK